MRMFCHNSVTQHRWHTATSLELSTYLEDNNGRAIVDVSMLAYLGRELFDDVGKVSSNSGQQREYFCHTV